MSRGREAETPPAEGAEPAKKKSPIKAILIVVIVMVVEAVGMFMFLKAGGPSESHAGEHAHLQFDPGEETIEIEVVSDKFQNLQTGVVWIWDIQVVVQVKSKHADRVQAELERRSAEIREGISGIISRAQHVQLKEPERVTLNRQLSAYFSKVFDPMSEGIIERVFIPRARGFPAEG